MLFWQPKSKCLICKGQCSPSSADMCHARAVCAKKQCSEFVLVWQSQSIPCGWVLLMLVTSNRPLHDFSDPDDHTEVRQTTESPKFKPLTVLEIGCLFNLTFCTLKVLIFKTLRFLFLLLNKEIPCKLLMYIYITWKEKKEKLREGNFCNHSQTPINTLAWYWPNTFINN